jgi:IS1 family transposase
MYSSKYDAEFRDEVRFSKKIYVWIVLSFLLIGGLVWAFNRAERTVDSGIVHYEEFQEIYNTCQKINTDLATIKAIPDDDKAFSAFSKQQQIAAKKQQLTRWVEEYNAKSKMWNRSMWKSKEPCRIN